MPFDELNNWIKKTQKYITEYPGEIAQAQNQDTVSQVLYRSNDMDVVYMPTRCRIIGDRTDEKDLHNIPNLSLKKSIIARTIANPFINLKITKLFIECASLVISIGR